MRKLRLADILLYLSDDILVKTDRTTMAVSLEGREPFLDANLFSFSAALPDEILLNGDVGKYILRKILKKYVPEDFVMRGKHGFGMPLDRWLRNELACLVDETLSHEKLKKVSLINPACIEKIRKEFASGKSQLSSHRLWLLMVLHAWAERYFTV